MMKTIYYFRHGETEWNRIGRFQGHSDIPLNQTGIEQAKQLQPFMQQWQPQILISSDLIRAQQTARLANATLQIPHLIDPRLREIHLGQAEGKTLTEVETLWGKQAIQDWISPYPELGDFSFPDGEKKIDSVKRVKHFLETLLIELPYQSIAICGHGGTLKRFCHFIAADKSKQFPIPNCCVYQITFNSHTKTWMDSQLITPVDDSF